METQMPTSFGTIVCPLKMQALRFVGVTNESVGRDGAGQPFVTFG